MGAFYVNITLQGPDQSTVAAALGARDAFVSPTRNRCTVVYDAQCEEQDTQAIAKLTSGLSQQLSCPALVVLNHDDDILWYQLYQSGNPVDQYDSTPGYFDPGAEPSAPAGGDARKLCAAFGIEENTQEVDRVLRKMSYGDDGYVFAMDRHRDLIKALGLPEYAIGFGYNYIADGELPEGLTADDLKNTTV